MRIPSTRLFTALVIPSTRLFTALVIAVTLLLAVPWAAEAVDTVYSIARDDTLLRVVSLVDASTLSSVTITLAGKTVIGGLGLAAQPGTGTLWGLLRISGQAGRELVTIDPVTGVATSVGDTTGSFSAIAFNAAGTLYGVTGEIGTGGLDPETLFTLSTTTAAPTEVCNLGNGSDGEAIAFHPGGGLLYHASGLGTVIFETVDTAAACAITDIPIGGGPLQASEAMALAFWQAQGAFLWSQGFTLPSAKLYQVTPGGAATLIGPLDHVSKGLAIAVIDHFACYTALPSAKLPAMDATTLADQFRNSTVKVTKATFLCNPANKNGENPGAETHPDHLVAYDFAQIVPKFTPVLGLKVDDQFGTRHVDALTPDRLLVPSAKSLIAPPPPSDPAIDHFLCYTVKTTAGTPAFVRINGVNVVDQFGARQVDLTKPSRLCNPVNKNNEEPGAETHAQHLMCYEALPSKSSPKFTPVSPIFVDNQFGPQQLKATTPSDLCVPARKTQLQ